MWQPWNQHDKFKAPAYVCWKDCGAGGSCQFLSIAEALCPYMDVSSQQLRQLCINFITTAPDETIEKLLEDFAAEKLDPWFPSHLLQVTTRQDWIQIMEDALQPGNGYLYQGDAFTLQMLNRVLNIFFVILEMKKGFIFRFGQLEHSDVVIFLRHWCDPNHMHYQAIGIQLYPGQIQTVFYPEEIRRQYPELNEWMNPVSLQSEKKEPRKT